MTRSVEVRTPTKRELVELLRRAADEMAATSSLRDSLTLKMIRETLVRVKS